MASTTDRSGHLGLSDERIIATAGGVDGMVGWEGGDVKLLEDVTIAAFLQGEGATIVSLQGPDDGAGVVIVADDSHVALLGVVDAAPGRDGMVELEGDARHGDVRPGEDHLGVNIHGDTGQQILSGAAGGSRAADPMHREQRIGGGVGEG